MALINCPECGKETSNLAVSCPHCGIPIVNVTVEEGGIRRTETQISKVDRIKSVLVLASGAFWISFSYIWGNGTWVTTLIRIAILIVVVLLALLWFLPNQVGKCPYCGDERFFPAVRKDDIDTALCHHCHKIIKVYRDHYETVPEETVSKNENNS